MANFKSNKPLQDKGKCHFTSQKGPTENKHLKIMQHLENTVGFFILTASPDNINLIFKLWADNYTRKTD